jgi:two-component system chemotaxis sensor kinase CheA
VTVHELGGSAADEPVAQPEPAPAAGPTSVEQEATPRPEPAEDETDLSLRSLSQTVRVDLPRLDHLMNLVGELGLVRTNLGDILDELRGREDASSTTRELQIQLRVMDRKLSLLQQGILDVRMVPLGQVFDKLARVVRKLGRESGKEIRLRISGAETELDKLIVEELSDPLMHMVRNCIDHGIESAAERLEAGKPAAGRIDLRAFQKGNRVVIEVADDGRGIDWRDVRDIAVEHEFIEAGEAAELTANEAVNLIFGPGFTTRSEATEVSGRGVGMDVVKTNISRLSGMIDVETTPGKGTIFSITLPVTLAIIQALVIESAGQIFCIPLNSVLESIMVRRSEILTVEGHEVISLRGRTLPLVQLSRLFGLGTPGQAGESQRIYVVIVGLAQHRLGLVVDELLGQHDVVIKPLARVLRQVPGIAGATELGANRTVLLLDVGAMVGETLVNIEATTPGSVPGAGA